MRIGMSLGRAGTTGATAALLLALTTVGCGGQSGGGTASNKPCSSSSSDHWTAQQVAAKTSPYNVQPVYDVPKGLTNCTIGFINPGKSIPFFQTWSTAMHDAASLYGFTFIEDDVALKYENEATSFQQMSVRNPAVVGAHPGNPALLAAAQAAKIPLVTLDAQVTGNPYWLGVPNDEVGTTAGQKVAQAAKDKLNGAWSGKTVVYVGLSAGGCAPCDARVQAGLTAVRSVLNISDSNVVISEKSGGDPTGGNTVMTDILTAHPNSVFVIVPLNDESGIGALRALDQAHRLQDALMVTLGADKIGRDALRNPSYEGTLLGAIDFNPYAEGWDLITAAIAIARGDKFQPYTVHAFLTSATVNNAYPLPDNRA